MLRYCANDNCGRLIIDGEEVGALVLVRYHEIPSRNILKFSEPEGVLAIYHKQCVPLDVDGFEGGREEPWSD